MSDASRVEPVRTLYQAYLWRILHAMLPLGQRFNPLLSWLLGAHGYIAVPWGRYWLTIAAPWLDVASTASAPIYRSPRRQNPEFFSLLGPHLKPSSPGHIVDVGANIGVYVLNIRAATPAPLLAFEPDPDSCRLLQHNVAANALASASVKNCACGDSAGQIAFRRGINGAVAGRVADADATLSVPVVRLDDELRGLEAVDLIKIDCEGFEWQVLKGCMETLAVKRPVLFVELHPTMIDNYGRSLTQVFDLFRPSYTLEFWDLNPAHRSRSRLRRFLGRYRDRLVRLAGEAEALALAARVPRPDQLFLLGVPRGNAS